MKTKDQTKKVAATVRNREELYEYAWAHMEESGDAEGARIYLDAARPQWKHVRSPHDWLEWVDNVLYVLKDNEMASEGIREAENCARGELMNYWPMWDFIAKAWLKIGSKEEARRALIEGPPTSSLEETVGIAALWMEAFDDKDKARECLNIARTKLTPMDKTWEGLSVPSFGKIAAGWISILGDHDEAEKHFAAAESIVTESRSWLYLAEARHAAGQFDIASDCLIKAEKTIAGMDDVTRLADRWKDLFDDRETAMRILRDGEKAAKDMWDWSKLEHAYQCMNDDDGVERCRKKLG